MGLIKEQTVETLYQVQVELGNNRYQMVGPAFNQEGPPGDLADEINRMIQLGREKKWKKASVISVFKRKEN